MTGRRITTADIGKPGLREWLTVHNLDPRRVCALPGAEPVVRGDRVEATVYVLDADGRKFYDPDRGGVTVELLEVPLLAPLPDHLGTETP